MKKLLGKSTGVGTFIYFYFLVSHNPNDLPNTNPQSSEVNNLQRRTSLHPLEEVELNRRVTRKRTPSGHIAQSLSIDENINEENQSQQSSQRPTSDDKNTNDVRMSSLFEGYSSVTSNDSRYLDSRRTNEKLKDLIVFLYTEPSIMFYSNVFLMVSCERK